MEIFIPKEVSFLIDTIYENGYEAFMVGGCVRDSILNLTPNDYDITTSATPQEIMNIFKDYKIIDTGIKHGTVSIILNNNIYEITTYRIEGEYENNRRPKNVEFTSNIDAISIIFDTIFSCDNITAFEIAVVPEVNSIIPIDSASIFASKNLLSPFFISSFPFSCNFFNE